ncbi:MFS transporter [Bacillus sp. BRMEA1]|uniref:MFS transporter n=1 Tax=Neobacillus endophyticus TaxID=2738405 RepID=UPI0015654B5B|nr:MFS transporter [Neobacillus endophyticus]NRD79974.1 MFS transporter [Neobacillus endophyticus]
MGIFKNKSFRKLFLASFASQLGTTLGNVAFAFYLLDRFSKQPYLASLAELMYSLPTLFVFFLIGVFADRMDRKKIAVNLDWIRAGLTLLLFMSLTINQLWLIFVILFVRSALSKFFAPAETSILQGILDQEQYAQASGFNQTVMGLFMLFGMGLGALSYHFIGFKGTVIIDGISFIVSALFIQSCDIPLEVRLPNGKSNWREMRLATVLTDFKQGLVYILNNKLLTSIISGFLVFGLINGAFTVLPLFTMKYKLAPNDYAQFTSLFSIFLGVGFIIGSVVGSALIKRFSLHGLIIIGVILSGAGTFVLGMLNQIWMYLILVLIMGIIISPVNIAINSWMAKLVDPKYMGRVSGWGDPLMMLAHSVSLGIIAVIFPAFVTVDSLYYAVGGLLILVGTYYLLILPKLVRNQSIVSQITLASAKQE